MHFSLLTLTGVIALDAASPVPAPLEARAVCKAPPTTTATINGATTTLTGPSKLTSSSTNTAVAKFNGRYAKYTSDTFQNIVFGTVGSSGSQIFLNSAGTLHGSVSGTLSPAYEYSYRGTPHTAVKETPGGNTFVNCTINTSTCAFNGITNTTSDQSFLASISDQPDWALASSRKLCGIGCYPFQPYVVAASHPS